MNKVKLLLQLFTFLMATYLVTGCASTSSARQEKNPMAETWIQANKAYANRDWKNAQTLLKKITDALPEDSEGFFRLGVSAYRQGDLKLAKESFEQVIRLDPKNTKASFNLGILHLNNAYNYILQCSKNALTQSERKKYLKLAKKLADLQ